MKKIISILVMACMMTSCAGLKPDEMVKTDIQDNAVSTGTDIPRDPEQGQQENKEGWTTGSIIKLGFINSIIHSAVIILCIIIYNNYFREEFYQIAAMLDTKLTIPEISEKFEREGNEINFNIEINQAPAICCTEWEFMGFKIRKSDDSFIIISQSPNRTYQIAKIEENSRIISGLQYLFGIKSVPPRSIKITSEKQDDIDFLNKLIKLKAIAV